MKLKLYRLLFSAMKLSLTGILLQCLFFNLLFASKSEAQEYKSVREVQLNIRLEDASLQEAFQAIEDNSHFIINYDDRHLINNKVRINFNGKNHTVADVLLQISKEAHLKFRQVNNSINVERLQNVPKEKELEIIIDGITITGKVTSSEDGEGLPGVNVILKGTSQGTVTDVEGDYKIDVPSSESILVFSSVGYQKEEIVVGEKTIINMTLAPDIQSLQEIVVVGYGTQKKSDLTGSVSSIKNDDFNKGVTTSLDQLIQGKAAGVQVVQNSSEPGGGVSISIRGASSINAGTGPLYVIDGLPLDNSPTISATGAEYVVTRSPRNPLSSINPSDIESIEILKDASATAIYGARGANGVIMITTKKGKAGALRVNYDGYVGVQNVAHKVDLLSATQYRDVLNAIIDDGGGSEEDRVTTIQDGGTDWQDELFMKNAVVQNHNISFSGGTEKTDYFISLNYFGQDGVVKSSSFQRYSARINVNSKVTDKFELGVNFNTNYSIDNYVPVGFGINGESGAIYAALNFDPTLGVKDENGNYVTSPFLDVDNPLALAYGTESIGNTFRTYGTVYGNYEIVPHLFFKLNVGGDVLNQRKDVYVGRQTRHGAPAGGIATILQGQKTSYLVEGTMTYDAELGQNHLTALLGATTQRFVDNNTNNEARGFPSDATATYNMGLGNPASFNMGSNKASNRLLSYLGRINYNLGDRYLVTASMRIDGSSRFGANHKYGYFPSLAAAWKINQEEFFNGINTFSTFKLRGSWGQTGNQEIGNYAAISTFGAGPTAVLDDQPVSTTAPSRLANPDLKWETTEQLDIGLDVGILEDRVTASIDYYHKKTFDMLLELPVPTSTGFTSKLSNVGSIENTGFELTLFSRNLDGEFKWNTTLNLSSIKNNVLDLGGIPKILTGDAGFANQIFLIQEGLPLRSFYGYQIIGIWQEGDDFSETTDNVQPGDLKFKDVNGDGTVNADDRVVLGNSFPKLSWSLGNTLSYKNFNLDIFFEGLEGVKMINNNLVDAYFPIQFRRNRFAEPYLNRWTPENPSDKYPSFVNPTGQGQKSVNSYTVEDASYIRLKTVRLSYTIPEIRKVIKNATIYITGENLLTFTSYDGYDPAVNPNGNATSRIDYNAYPTATTVLLGVQLGF